MQQTSSPTRPEPLAEPRALQRTALLIVDMQKDFMPGGAVPVPGGAALVPLVNRLAAAVAAAGGCVVATADWHPPDHVSFFTSHPGRQALDVVTAHAPGGRAARVTLFTPHCVAGSAGAGFADGLDPSPFALQLRKGREPQLEYLSAFGDLTRTACTELAAWLRERGVQRLLVCGVATEYCVRATVLDALAEGFATAVLTDAVAGVDQGACQRALQEVLSAGAELLSGARLLEAGRAGLPPPSAELDLEPPSTKAAAAAVSLPAQGAAEE